MKDKFGAVLDVFCLRQALKESNKMCDVCGEMVPLKVNILRLSGFLRNWKFDIRDF